MARIAAGAGLMGFAVALATVIGCGPAKELPDEPPEAQGRGPQQQVPTVSEEAAKKVYELGVKTVTGGKPESRAKAKAVRVFASGEFVQPNQGIAPDTGRRLQTVWPDRVHWVYDFKGGMKQSVWIRGSMISTHNGQSFVELPSIADAHRGVMVDLYAQHYFPLALPVPNSGAPGEPKVIVHKHQHTPGDPGTDTIQVVVDKLPPFQLTYDAKTHLLQKVTYTVASVDVTAKSAIEFGKYAPVDGLTLPFEIKHFRNNDKDPVERWTVQKWEFPGKIEDVEFSPPKD